MPSPPRRLRVARPRAAGLFVCGLLAGCMLTSATPPMRALDHTARGPARAEGLVVFLHGLGDDAGSFERRGVVDAVQAQGWDAVAVGAHFGFYRGFTLVDRLAEDVIGPARAMGYRKLWLVGVSMGGFGALSYAEAHPRDVDGVILMAPYLGEAEVLEEVRRAGADAWDPGELATMEDGRDRQSRAVLAWLVAQARSPRGVPIFLGFGSEDPSAENHRWLASLLPPDRVFTRAGGHKWTVWAPLFDELIPRALGQRAEAREVRGSAASWAPLYARREQAR